MANSQTIDDVKQVIANIKELAQTYEQVSQTHIPTTLRQAKEEAWVLAPQAVVVAGLVQYSSEEQKHDRQRVIPLYRALNIMESLEDSLIEKTVQSPRQLFVRQIRFYLGILRFAVNALPILWDAAKVILGTDDAAGWLEWFERLLLGDPETTRDLAAFAEVIFELGKRYLWLVLTGLFTALGTELFARGALDCQREHLRWAQQARRLCLPQRNQKRYWRRKVARL